MSMDMFIHMGSTIKGESKDAAHADEIDVLSWNWGLSNSGSFHTGGGGGAGKVNIQDLTSIGLGDPTARVSLDYTSLRSGMVVADVIFNPPETIFLREAAKRGCKTLDGLGMLVNQGKIGIEYSRRHYFFEKDEPL